MGVFQPVLDVLDQMLHLGRLSTRLKINKRRKKSRSHSVKGKKSRSLCLPCMAGTQMGGSMVSLGALGHAACSPMNLLSGTAPGTVGSASVRAASLSYLS